MFAIRAGANQKGKRGTGVDLDELIARLQEIRAEHGNVPKILVEIRDVQERVYSADWDKDRTEFVFLATE